MHKSVLVIHIFIFLLLSSLNKLHAQFKTLTVSGLIKDKVSGKALSYVNVVLKTEKEGAFISGTVSNDQGRFAISSVKPGTYQLETSVIGYIGKSQTVFVGSLSEFLELAAIELEVEVQALEEVVVIAKVDEVSAKMDKKSYSVADNISQTGGSILQTMQNLPGITVQDSKVQLRGNDKVIVLIDGKQTALTGFGSQTGLDNLPASSVDKIEVINNPSAKYDANGNAGIINIVLKKNKQDGFNGKIGISSGLGALWVRKENLPTIRPQYQTTPKINPSISLNYRKNKTNIFFQADNLYTQTLNKNEFVTRTYSTGEIINHQLKRNRNTNFFNSKVGIDRSINENNMFTVFVLYGTEKIIDRGDQPFFNANFTERKRLWQFLEDELKTTVMASSAFRHNFKQPGHSLSAGISYTFHREDEKYFFDNILPAYSGKDAFELISDEHVADLNIDYVRPLRYGKIEGGVKFRYREIPTDMLFIPGLNSPLDVNAGGWATYGETIPALYGNYIFENPKFEAEVGLRVEYVGLNYKVNPDHSTYKSDGYHYTQPFPNVRLAYKMNANNKLSIFYNRRVDRPNEVDIRIFPKYDDAEIIKVGNPALRPQFTNSLELGYKTNWSKGYFYSAMYHRVADGTITRISSSVPNSNLIYAVFQNINRSYTEGLEAVVAKEFGSLYSFNLNLNGFNNRINAFTVENKYPIKHTFSAEKQKILSGNIKLNNTLHLPKNVDVQLTAIYLAPDIIPQGKIKARSSVDLGLKKILQKGKGELFINATDLFNTMIIKKEIRGEGFDYSLRDYYETQVIRLGYNYKF